MNVLIIQKSKGDEEELLTLEVSQESQFLSLATQALLLHQGVLSINQVAPPLLEACMDNDNPLTSDEILEFLWDSANDDDYGVQ